MTVRFWTLSAAGLLSGLLVYAASHSLAQPPEGKGKGPDGKGGFGPPDGKAGFGQPGGKGFGQTTSTSGETDVVGSAKAFVNAVTDSPGKALGVLTGNEKFMKEKVHQSGVSMSDASYERLVKLAAQSESVWIKFWAGSMATLADWRKTRIRIRNAPEGDRAEVAAALADFESGSGRGRHETVRAAITGTVVPFEFPDALSSRKPMYESFVLADPIAEALGAGNEAAALAKLGDLVQQMQGLRDDLSKNLKAFGRPEDCLDMCDRLDHRIEAARAELARLKKNALPKPAASGKAVALGIGVGGDHPRRALVLLGGDVKARQGEQQDQDKANAHPPVRRHPAAPCHARHPCQRWSRARHTPSARC